MLDCPPFGTIEAVPEMIEVFFPNACSLVVDGDTGERVLHPYLHHHRSSRGRIGERIRQIGRENVLDPPGIGDDGHPLFRRGGIQHEKMRWRSLALPGDYLSYERAQIFRVQGQGERIGLDPCIIDQVIDHLLLKLGIPRGCFQGVLNTGKGFVYLC